MFLKAQDFNKDGWPLPQFYECERILPGTDGRTWSLTLESKAGSVVIELQKGWNYYVLNDHGGNVDTIRVPRQSELDPDATLKLYATPEKVGWRGYIERPNGGVLYWITLEGRCIPNTHCHALADRGIDPNSLPGISVDDLAVADTIAALTPPSK